MKEINITEKDENQRIDKYLMKYFNKAPKSFIYKMLRKKRIKCNNRRIEGNEILKNGDILQMYISDDTMFTFMEKKHINIAKKSFDIVYEDDNVIFVSKPSGLLTHSEKISDKDTLIDQILYYLYQKGEYIPSVDSVFTPAVCNRLDRNTSGIVIAGKNLMSVQELNKAILNNNISKKYITIVFGKLKKNDFKIKSYILKDNINNKSYIFDEYRVGSKEIITKYNVLDYNKVSNYSLLEVELITGKSHQIRAQLSYIGNPIIGDKKYGNKIVNNYFKEKYGLNNQFLHAYKLVLNIENNKLSYLNKKEFVSNLPKNFYDIQKDIFFNI